MKVPFLDLYEQYKKISKEIDDSFHSVFHDTTFLGGSQVKKFEENYAHYLDVKHCIGVGNGTDAMIISLKALGIGKGDEVIVPANTFIATSEAVTAVGAQPVFVDCDPDFYTIDVAKIKSAITSKTKAIIPVHLYGHPVDMDEIIEIAVNNDLFIIENASQAHGAIYKGKKVGSLGDIGTFGFNPGCNFGAYGNGGAIVTNNDQLAKLSRLYANHGRVSKYDHEIEGMNSCLDDIQAAMLNVKLNYLDLWNRTRKQIAHMYDRDLKSFEGIVTPEKKRDVRPVYNYYVVRINHRKSVRKYLHKEGVETGIHYPIGLPFLSAYKKYNFKPEDFPVTYNYQNKLLSLPVYPELKKQSVNYIIDKLYNFRDGELVGLKKIKQAIK